MSEYGVWGVGTLYMQAACKHGDTYPLRLALSFSCLARSSASSDDMMAFDDYALSISDGGGAMSPSSLNAIPAPTGSSPRETHSEVNKMFQQHHMGSQLCGEGSLLDTVLAAMWDESMAEGLFR